MEIKIPREYLIAAIILAIIGVIGIVMIILGSSPPWFLTLGEMISLFGLLGSWITLLTGATMWGQREIIRLQRETIGLQKETVILQRKTVEWLEKVSMDHEKIMKKI